MNMNETYQRILAGLERIADENSRARIDDLSRATGIDNRTINNALRYLKPDYIRIAGRAERGPLDGGGDRPKILELTDKGRTVGEQHGVEMTDDQFATIMSDIHTIYARLTELEEVNAQLVKRNRRLMRYILEEDP